MYKINIETAQNIPLSFPAASLVERIGAYLIDFVIQILFFVIIQMILDGIVTDWFSEEQRAKYYSLVYLFYLPILFYHLIFEYFNNGQSIGKQLLKLKVVHVDGTRPTLSSYFTRWITGLLEFYLFMGSPAMLFIMFTNQSQRIGDIAANTSVIKLKTPTLLRSASDQYNFSTEYEPIYSKASLLNDGQIALMNRVLYQENIFTRNQQIMLLAEKIEATYNIKRKEMPQRQYIEQLIKDYTFTNWLEENNGQIETLKFIEHSF